MADVPIARVPPRSSAPPGTPMKAWEYLVVLGGCVAAFLFALFRKKCGDTPCADGPCNPAYFDAYFDAGSDHDNDNYAQRSGRFDRLDASFRCAACHPADRQF